MNELEKTSWLPTAAPSAAPPGERAAGPSRAQQAALAVGFVVALLGPPVAFAGRRLAAHDAWAGRPEAHGLVAGDLLHRPARLLLPALFVFALPLVGALAALFANALARPWQRAHVRLHPAPAATSGPGEGGELADGALPAREGAASATYLLNQQEAFQYVDAIDDRAERALAEAALAHVISFLLLDEHYAAEFKSTPMNLLMYVRAVHAFALGPRAPSVPPPGSEGRIVRASGSFGAAPAHQVASGLFGAASPHQSSAAAFGAAARQSALPDADGSTSSPAHAETDERTSEIEAGWRFRATPAPPAREAGHEIPKRFAV